MREGWTYKKLNEVCDKGSSNIVINKLEDNNGDYPLYGASGLVKNVDFYHQDKPYIGIVKDGAGVGRVNTYPAYSSLVGTMQYIFAKEDCLLDYIKYFLVKLDLSHCVSGATIPHIYFKDYGKERIPVPSLSEQQSIVAELDKINELISLKKAQLSDLDSLAQSIFYDMFGDPIENEKGWEVKKLGEICNIGTGATPSRIQENRYYGGNIPWVKTTEVCYQDIYDTEEKITPLAIEETNCKLYPEGTLLMAMYGQGKTRGQVAKLMVPAATNQACAAIIVNVEKLHIDYLYMFLIIQYDNIRAMAQGGNQANLNMKLVGSISIPLPPLSLQQEFAKRIELIEQQKAQIGSTIKDLETLLASRMQYWFD